MCHSTSIKNLHQSTTILSNNDEEQISDLMSFLLDNIDKKMNSSIDSPIMLFNASSNNRHRISSDNTDDFLFSFDDSKHSIGVLVDDKDITSRKYFV
jgi:hypothetical protein